MKCSTRLIREIEVVKKKLIFIIVARRRGASSTAILVKLVKNTNNRKKMPTVSIDWNAFCGFYYNNFVRKKISNIIT